MKVERKIERRITISALAAFGVIARLHDFPNGSDTRVWVELPDGQETDTITFVVSDSTEQEIEE